MANTKWALDPTHSEIHFKVRHMMVSTVTGHFKKFDATVETQGDDVTTAKVHFTTDVDSISTNNEQRDGHLKSNDFLDMENHPQITFNGEGLVKTSGEEYTMNGMLTMRGVSKEVTLHVDFGGVVQDPWGNTRTGFSVTAKINRKDFGVNFSMVSEAGGIMLGDEVTLNANLEFVKVAAAVTA